MLAVFMLIQLIIISHNKYYNIFVDYIYPYMLRLDLGDSFNEPKFEVYCQTDPKLIQHCPLIPHITMD